MGVTLAVSHLRFGYPGCGILLDDISLRISGGEALCLLGPNGAGKTSLLRCLLGIQKPSEGQIAIEGDDIQHLTRKKLAQKIAYVPQSSSTIFPFTVFDMVLMGRLAYLRGISTASAEDKHYAHHALERLGIGHLTHRFFNEISGGERQLTLIARALCQQAKTVILDEPTANLDYGNQIRTLEVIGELRCAGYAIIMTTHDPNHALSSATSVAILKNGKLTHLGDPDKSLTGTRLSELYSTGIQVVTANLPDDPDAGIKVCIPAQSSKLFNSRKLE
jgi:iron complex transport system ATP-binding protein